MLKFVPTLRILIALLLPYWAMAQSAFHVDHYALHIQLRSLSQKHLEGTALLTIYASQDSVKTIQLDLLKLPVKVVSDSSHLLAFSQTDSTLTLQLAQPINRGDSLHLTIEYGGSPVNDASWGGFYFNGIYAFNMGVGFSSNPHSYGRCWFPCRDVFTDKASYEFHITTDSGYRAVCNGFAKTATLNNDSSITWHWYQNQKIPAYLASVAVAPYIFIQHDYKGTKKTYPVMFACVRSDSAKLVAGFANVDKALKCFESRFGIYPFDRVGYVVVPFNGGAMEHAANIAYPQFAVDGTLNYETLYGHELSHAWWGDWVTCKTEQDMWLNEGWASFCEALFMEYLYGYASYMQQMKANWTDVLKNAASADGGNLILNQIPHSATYGKHVYKKGALVVHSLRNVMGDAAFFEACKAYQTLFAQGNASSDDMLNEFQKHTSEDIRAFFEGYVFHPGNCNFRIGTLMIDSSSDNYLITTRIRQDIANRTDTFRQIPIPVTFYNPQGKAFNFYPRYIGDTVYTFKIPKFLYTNPVFALIDPRDDLFKARTMQNQIIKTTGIKSFSDAQMSLNVSQISDSANLYISENWTGSAWKEVGIPGINIHSSRFWSIQGTLPTQFSAQGYFNYTNADDGAFIDRSEDSLIILYRPDAFSKWFPDSSFTLNTGSSKTDKAGRITVNKIKIGEYIFGKLDRSAGLNETHTLPGIIIYPNPAKNTLNIHSEIYLSNPEFQIIDLNGKLLSHKKSSVSGHDFAIDSTELKPGIYIIRLENGSRKWSEKCIIEP